MTVSSAHHDILRRLRTGTGSCPPAHHDASGPSVRNAVSDPDRQVRSSLHGRLRKQPQVTADPSRIRRAKAAGITGRKRTLVATPIGRRLAGAGFCLHAFGLTRPRWPLPAPQLPIRTQRDCARSGHANQSARSLGRQKRIAYSGERDRISQNANGGWEVNVISSANSSDRERYIIGRGDDCHIIVSDPTVSRAHSCLIMELDGTYTLVDIGSTRGTSVYRAGAWQRIQEERVVPEDRVLIGDFETTLSNLLLQLQDVQTAHSKVRDKLFISYRRADTEPVAGRIFDFLCDRYGAGRVFFDTEAIPGAVDFRKRIHSAISESSSVLAVIGPNWSSRRRRSMFQFFRRRPSKVDFVEVEIEEAIRVRVPVIPILVMGAPMPSAETLAPSIRSIVNLNTLSVRPGRDFHQDMNLVSQTIDRYRLGQD